MYFFCRMTRGFVRGGHIIREISFLIAKTHIDWSREQWSQVIFTDESKFNRSDSDERSYVRQQIGEEFNDIA